MYIRENNEKRDVEYSHDTAPYQPTMPSGPKPKKVSKLQAENARLKKLHAEELALRDKLVVKLEGELEALRPQPVVETANLTVALRMENITGNNTIAVIGCGNYTYEELNLKLEFHDGVLVSAKVKNAEGGWE